MDPSVIAYIAGEAARRYGPADGDLARKLRRNIRRNQGVLIPEAQIAERIDHYKAAYAHAASALPRFRKPATPGTYADWSDIDTDGLVADLRRAFPDEPDAIIDLLLYYVVHYEHLR